MIINNVESEACPLEVCLDIFREPYSGRYDK